RVERTDGWVERLGAVCCGAGWGCGRALGAPRGLGSAGERGLDAEELVEAGVAPGALEGAAAGALAGIGGGFIEVVPGDGEGADEVAGAGWGDEAVVFGGDDGGDGGLDALGSVEIEGGLGDGGCG